MLFCRSGTAGRILIEKPMTNFTEASDQLKEHSQKKAALEDMESYYGTKEIT